MGKPGRGGAPFPSSPLRSLGTRLAGVELGLQWRVQQIHTHQRYAKERKVQNTWKEK